MTEPKHTPGPWDIDPDGDICDRDGRTIACMTTFDNDGRDLLTADECEGNRRLIAAAPAMFDALRRIVHAYEWRVAPELRQAALEAIEMAGWRA